VLLRKGEKFGEQFDHLNAGTDRDGNQKISSFAGRDIFPFLSDHFVISRFEYLTLPECPDEDTDGVIDLEMDVHYNANQGSLTGIALVLYGKKRDFADATPRSRSRSRRARSYAIPS
jgi:hypothetical protein